jgi:hypothetical protein
VNGIPEQASLNPVRFRAYRPESAQVPIACVTPGNESFTHTFYDVCPFSPCGRYLAVTRFPYQGKKPILGDEVDVCVIDLESETIESVYRTQAWSFQLGANVQWGPASERALYTNDVVGGLAVCVRVDLNTREAKFFAGPKYDLASDASFAVGPNLSLINATQDGYGIPDPEGAPPPTRRPGDGSREGIWYTDLLGGETRLLVSLDKLESVVSNGNHRAGVLGYPFHTRLNRQGTHILQVLRFPGSSRGQRNPCLLTFSVDGSDLQEAIDQTSWSTQGALGGRANHPNWHPDGKRILLNMVPAALGLDNMLFCLVNADGSNLEVLSERHLGSGHPSINPSGRLLLTDAYPKQSWVVTKSGEIPLRILDLKTDRETQLCTVSVDLGGPGRAKSKSKPLALWPGIFGRGRSGRQTHTGSHFKLDPHPAWDHSGGRVCFNGAVDGQRQVFVAHLSSI